MSRIVSVWLPRWPVLRALAAQTKQATEKSIAPDRPFVLVVAASGGPRITALNEAAEAAGLTPGEPLADARAKADFLQVRDADPAADDAALRKLALWATRYTPTVSPWNDDNGADGFFLDIEGASHLFGGEEKLIADLAGRLEKNFALPTRIAVADTAGAAWALSRFHRAPLFVLPSGQEAAALSPLPIAALRLAPETRSALRRLGFKTVGALLDKPRAPFAARFPSELLRRIDQALGRTDEPLVPIVAPPIYHCLRYLLEPIFTQEAVVAHASRLMQTLTHVLARDDAGARRLRLGLYNVDGAVETVDIALTLPTRSVAHVARLIDLKLDALNATQRRRLRLRNHRPCCYPRRTAAGAADGITAPSAGENQDGGIKTSLNAAPFLLMRCANGLAQQACAASRQSPATSPSAPKCCRRSRRSIRLAGAGQPRPLLLLPQAPSRPKSQRSCLTARRGNFSGAA